MRHKYSCENKNGRQGAHEPNIIPREDSIPAFHRLYPSITFVFDNLSLWAFGNRVANFLLGFSFILLPPPNCFPFAHTHSPCCLMRYVSALAASSAKLKYREDHTSPLHSFPQTNENGLILGARELALASEVAAHMPANVSGAQSRRVKDPSTEVPEEGTICKHCIGRPTYQPDQKREYHEFLELHLSLSFSTIFCCGDAKPDVHKQGP